MRSDRPRSFEYSSLVMGSRDIPTVSYSLKPPPILNNTKIFSRKNDLLATKYAKTKHKIRTRNERPDIFLEG